MNRIKNYIHNPRVFWTVVLNHIAPFIKDDAQFIKMKWKLLMDYPLNLDNPQTFNEKLQWLKLHDRKPIYTTMVDKYEAKKYVADIIGEEYIIPTLAVYDRVEDIDFDALPNQFVLKCTHDSGGLVICRDKSKIDKKSAIKKLRKHLGRTYFWQNREWPYKNVKPRIIAEQYMSNVGENSLTDFKIHNFNGTPEVILVCKDRFGGKGMTEDFYNSQWEHLDISRIAHPNASTAPKKPVELDEMLHLSKELSKDIPFVRTDFYTVGHKVYFGELTFYPASGTKPFSPEQWDKILGEWLVIDTLDSHGGGI